MLTQRQRPVLYAAIAIVAVWILAWAGYVIAKNAKMTPEKLATALHDTDLSKLSAADRAKRLKALEDSLNALSAEDRRKARIDREWGRLFQQMTEQEKSDFLEATMPTGFKQMIASFEQMPEDKRKRAVNDAVKRLREARENMAAEASEDTARRRTNNFAEMSPQMQEKVIKMGLNAFYSESSAQSKAELAPFMEELQRSMESGRYFIGGRR